ncbi:PP2C family serine/threonine-protein phosphatase [Haloferula chungangensis]|uniref:PP2C family serine/threonine-protein phosphatase n=1 Tax=Haloferula chungangensis TaxID=1048331 RepID=A0ABW2L4C2_9BACT
MTDENTWSVAAASRRGVSHLQSKAPCQDAFGCWSSSLAGTPCSILAVSDGHGAEDYHHSHFGSFLAIRAAYEEFIEFFQWYALVKTGPSSSAGVQPTGLERDFKASFGRRIVRRWRENVKVFREEVLRSNLPFDESEGNEFKPFGCTLLAAMITSDRAFFFQLGDGGIFVRRNGGELLSLSEDDDGPGEATDSLASSDPEKAAVTSVLTLEEVSAVMLATDGLTKSFSKGDEEPVPKGIRQTVDWLLNRVSVEKLDVEGPVFDQFLDRCSKGGTGDDVTVALAFSRGALFADEKAEAAEETPQKADESEDATRINEPEADESTRPSESGTSADPPEDQKSDRAEHGGDTLANQATESEAGRPIKPLDKEEPPTEAKDVF